MTRYRDWERLKEASKNPLAAFFLVNAVLFLLLFVPTFWGILWAIAFSFLEFEGLMATVIGGGRGFFKLKQLSIGKRVVFKGATLTKGHAFLALFTLILGITGLSAIIADIGVTIVDDLYASNILYGVYFGTVWNLLASVGLYLYLKKGFFAKKN